MEYKKVLNVESIAPDDIQAYELLIGINRANQTFQIPITDIRLIPDKLRELNPTKSKKKGKPQAELTMRQIDLVESDKDDDDQNDLR